MIRCIDRGLAANIQSACNAFLGIEDLEAGAPTLASLSVSAGTLEPAFSPTVTSYRLAVPLATASLEVAAEGGVGVTELRLNGNVFSESATVNLVLGNQQVGIEAAQGDDATFGVSIEVIRAGQWTERQIVKASPVVEGSFFGSQLDGDANVFAAAQLPLVGRQGVSAFRRMDGAWVDEEVGAPPSCPLVSNGGEYGAAIAFREGDLFIGAPSCGNANDPDGGVVQRLLFSGTSSSWFPAEVFEDVSDPNIANGFGSHLALGDGFFAAGRFEVGPAPVILAAFYDRNNSNWEISSAIQTASFGNPGEPVSAMSAAGRAAVVARGSTFVLSRLGASGLVTAEASSAIASISLDENTVAVGLPDDADGSSGFAGPDPNLPAIDRSGAVAIFTRPDELSEFSREVFIKAPNPDVGDGFGRSVAVRGDLLVVGAPDEAGVAGDPSSNEAQSSGAVYVYVRNGTTWTQVAYIKPSNSEAQDFFGRVVKIVGDGLLISATGEDSGADPTANDVGNSGAVYYFE